MLLIVELDSWCT